MDGKQIILSLFSAVGGIMHFTGEKKSRVHLSRGWLALLHPHLNAGESNATGGFSEDKSLWVIRRCFTTAVVS